MMLGDLFLFVRVKAFVGLNVLFLVHGGGPSRGQAAVSEDTVFLVCPKAFVGLNVLFLACEGGQSRGQAAVS